MRIQRAGFSVLFIFSMKKYFSSSIFLCENCVGKVHRFELLVASTYRILLNGTFIFWTAVGRKVSMNRSSNQINKIKRHIDVCLVCGDVAQYSYYGSVVCQSCKMFFKRNAKNQSVSIEKNFLLKYSNFFRIR